MILLEIIVQTPPSLQPQPVQPPSLIFLNNALQIIATAVGTAVAAYLLVNKYADKIIKLIREVKSLTDRNNNNIESRSEEIKIKTDGLYGFIDQVQKHQAKAISETSHQIYTVSEELKKNTELTSNNCTRIEKLEKLINSQSETKESLDDSRKEEK
jgi:Na+-translocating ferredoxin:NAD+ oxidoreductase RNF subunit RnfB